MDRPKHKMIYYFPGLISLLILPWVFICQANKQIQRNSLGVIPIYFADVKFSKEYPELFDRFKGSFPPKRNYTEITFTGNNVYDQTKLSFAQTRIREILAQNDSIDGLHFKFGDSSQYGTFVKTVDILRKEDAETYMPLGDNLWFYHFPRDTSSHRFYSGISFLGNDVVYTEIEPKIPWQTDMLKDIKQFWKTSWQIIAAFAAFMVCILIFRRKSADG